MALMPPPPPAAAPPCLREEEEEEEEEAEAEDDDDEEEEEIPCSRKEATSSGRKGGCAFIARFDIVSAAAVGKSGAAGRGTEETLTLPFASLRLV